MEEVIDAVVVMAIVAGRSFVRLLMEDGFYGELFPRATNAVAVLAGRTQFLHDLHTFGIGLGV